MAGSAGPVGGASTGERPAKKRRELNAAWYVAAHASTGFIRLFGKYRWHHEERIPAQGAFILAPNHMSHIDVIVMGWLLYKNGRAPRFLAKASLFQVPVLGWILTLMGQIPVERKKGAGGPGLERAAALVEDGLGVIIYPEGTLTRDPAMWPMRGRVGAAWLALAHDIPVIPAAHWGAQNILPRYAKALRGGFPRKKVDILVGEPVDLSRWAGRTDGEALRAATDEIMVAITRLLAELRGEEPPATRWDPAAHGQAETGRFDGKPGGDRSR